MSALLHEALTAFGLNGAKAVFIQQHENAVYRVDDRYLLRIHKAADGLHADHDPGKRQAELAFLTHLADAGMPVQRPLAEAILADGTMATLLIWLEGHHIIEAEFTPDMQRQIGMMAARLHQAAQGFRHPAMRRYDATHVAQTVADICSMGRRYGLDAGEVAVTCQAAQVIEDRLRSAAAEFVPIHCDLSQSNILLTDGGLSPIDFSLFGLGHPMHDLGILIGNVSTLQQRKAIVDGYVQAGGRLDLPLLDAGLTLGLLEALVFHADVWPKEPWFAPRLTRWVNEMLQPLADGKKLLDENMYLLNI